MKSTALIAVVLAVLITTPAASVPAGPVDGEPVVAASAPLPPAGGGGGGAPGRPRARGGGGGGPEAFRRGGAWAGGSRCGPEGSRP